MFGCALVGAGIAELVTRVALPFFGVELPMDLSSLLGGLTTVGAPLAGGLLGAGIALLIINQNEKKTLRKFANDKIDEVLETVNGQPPEKQGDAIFSLLSNIESSMEKGSLAQQIYTEECNKRLQSLGVNLRSEETQSTKLEYASQQRYL